MHERPTSKLIRAHKKSALISMQEVTWGVYIDDRVFTSKADSILLTSISSIFSVYDSKSPTEIFSPNKVVINISFH